MAALDIEGMPIDSNMAVSINPCAVRLQTDAPRGRSIC
jgi:hypothetical protein